MDEMETVKKYGDRMAFLAGVDVQHLLPEGTTDEVRKGITEVISLYKRI